MQEGLILSDLCFLEWGPISLELPLRDIAGISGASGCGKSLLLRAIADLSSSSGELRWNGVLCSEVSAPLWRKRVGLLPANPVWWHDEVGAHFLHDVSDYIKQLGFESDVLRWEVARLSSGERQRLALVRMLDREPECLLLDEPTANLDGRSSEQVEALIRAYISVPETRRAAVLVSHDLSLLSRMSQQQWLMKDRRLHMLGEGAS